MFELLFIKAIVSYLFIFLALSLLLWGLGVKLKSSCCIVISPPLYERKLFCVWIATEVKSD